MSFVYIAQAGKRRHKIGLARNPQRRVAALASGSATALELAYVRQADNPRAIENMAHWLLRGAQLRGEWFEVDFEAARSAVDEAARLIAAGQEPPVRVAGPGPPNQELETILGRYPKGTKARIAKLLGDNPPKGALAELLRQALATELRKREKPSKG